MKKNIYSTNEYRTISINNIYKLYCLTDTNTGLAQILLKPILWLKSIAKIDANAIICYDFQTTTAQ